MGRRIHETIRRVVPRGFRTALIDFPNYFNVGDHAIWAGKRIALRSESCLYLKINAQGYEQKIL